MRLFVCLSVCLSVIHCAPTNFASLKEERKVVSSYVFSSPSTPNRLLNFLLRRCRRVRPTSSPFIVFKSVTAPFNNMRTLKFKAQPTNAFFATVDQIMFGDSSQLPTTAERAVIKSLSTVQTTKQCSAVIGSWKEPPNTELIDDSKKSICRLSNEF